ncbi:17232_t:CDS:2 [Racocetra fulgida]|uniref:17232_t:CDS:1 n=1 Tax=Racocetra fulgida TaxID=60492 RepID=A0A9N8VB84_9GLOM|nr:17232_t:CDS:2 [Racocetra fulgida]
MEIVAYKGKQKQPSKFQQINSLIKIKQDNPKLKQIFSQVLQNIPKQRKKKENPKAGLPQPKPLHRYNSFTYPQHGFKIEKGQLVLSRGRGYPNLKINIRLHTQKKRPLPKEIETCSIFRKNVKTKEPLTLEQLRTGKHLSLDMGLENFYTTNEGYKEPIPQFYRKAEKQLVKLQRIADHKQHKRVKGDKTKPSQRYLRAKLKISKFHEKIVNKRDDFVFKKVKELRDNYDFIAIEKLNPKKMIERRDKYKGLSKNINAAKNILFQAQQETFGAGTVSVRQEPGYQPLC